MPTYIRWRETGASFFFTVVTYRRQRILLAETPRNILRRAFIETRRELPFEILAFVLLPDHLHCVWQMPDGHDDFPERWRRIKSRFTHAFLAAGGRDWDVSEQSRKQGRHGVWQPRYWEHRIRDEEDWYKHRDYIHLNPVKHGYVSEPQAWEWSSIHRHIQMGWLDPDWPGTRAIELPKDVE